MRLPDGMTEWLAAHDTATVSVLWRYGQWHVMIADTRRSYEFRKHGKDPSAMLAAVFNEAAKYTTEHEQRWALPVWVQDIPSMLDGGA